MNSSEIQPTTDAGIDPTLFVLDPGALAYLQRKLTPKQCVFCCKPLTDPNSVQRGYGPDCARRVDRVFRNRPSTGRARELLRNGAILLYLGDLEAVLGIACELSELGWPEFAKSIRVRHAEVLLLDIREGVLHFSTKIRMAREVFEEYRDRCHALGARYVAVPTRGYELPTPRANDARQLLAGFFPGRLYVDVDGAVRRFER
jgi:hypothetical protein